MPSQLPVKKAFCVPFDDCRQISIGLCQRISRLVCLFGSNTLRSRACLSLSFPMSKIYGGTGCAMAISLTMVLANIIVINLYYYKKIHIDIPEFILEIIKLTLPVLASFIMGLLITYFFPINSIFSIGFNFLIYSILYIFLIWWKGMNYYEHQLFEEPIKNISLKFIGFSRINLKRL